MVTELTNSTQNQLYETDYNLWVLDTAEKLKNRELDSLDWENLIEEVLDLSRREKRKLESLLTRLFEHLLKLKYWESERERNRGHWQGEIRNFRIQIQRELKASPSLKRHLSETFEECYKDARKITIDKTQLSPDTFAESLISLCDCSKDIAPLDQILDEDWLPLEEEIMEESVTYQAILRKGSQREGLLLVKRQLKRRFGELSSGLEQRLQTLSVSQLEDLAEALLDFNDINDLSNWLENQKQ